MIDFIYVTNILYDKIYYMMFCLLEFIY